MDEQPCALVLTAGKGYGRRRLTAVDRAFGNAHIIGVNWRKLSSVPPAGVPVYTFAPDCPQLWARGERADAVIAMAASPMPGEVISAGVGFGLPRDPDRAGVIYFSQGPKLSAALCRDQLEEMVGEGMREIRGIGDYDFRCMVATDTVGYDGKWHAAAAALCFAEGDLWKNYFSPHTVPLP